MSDEYSNLPPGTFDGDPAAPWNAGDARDGETCSTCEFSVGVVDACGDVVLYACDFDRPLYAIDGTDDACEAWAPARAGVASMTSDEG